jgi:diguanylate cyclase (GGDEF)-like protein
VVIDATVKPTPRRGPLGRLHDYLFWDYTPAAYAWWLGTFVFALYLAAPAPALLLDMPGQDRLMIAFCVGMACLAAVRPINIPNTHEYVGGDIFVLLTVFVYGPTAGFLVLMPEGLCACLRTRPRFTAYVGTFAIPTISMWVAGSMYHGLVEIVAGDGARKALVHLGAAVLTGLVYVLIPFLLSRIPPKLKRLKSQPWREALGHRLWSMLAMSVAALIGSLLSIVFSSNHMMLLAAATCLVAGALSSLHYYERLRRAAAKHLADITEVAYTDSLTGLANRRRFHESLDALIADKSSYAVIFIDCDGFKSINDQQGHDAGDAFLKHVAAVLKTNLREGDLAARFGGDEFTLLLSPCDQPSIAARVAQRLVEAMRDSTEFSGVELRSTISVGLTHSSHGYSSRDGVLHDADAAMYAAKEGGKDRWVEFDDVMRGHAQHREALEQALRKAIDAGEIELAYQPIFTVGSGALVGFEALSRWSHATLGVIPPATFIPLAEQLGLLPKLTAGAIKQACAAWAGWQQDDEASSSLVLHVNVGVQDLAGTHLLDVLGAQLTQHAIPNGAIAIELTEGSAMDDFEAARKVLRGVRKLGVGVAIDDFGMGYSQLSRLVDLPFDTIKIDSSLVQNMMPGRAVEVVRTIVALGRALGKQVVAEGIETEAQLERLRAMGCDHGQGYLVATPMPRHAATNYIRAENARHRLVPVRQQIEDSGFLPTMH